jgi:hypothetical protein
MYPGAAPLVITRTIPLLAVVLFALFVAAHRRARASWIPPLTWVCYVPFVWLPTVLVPAAFAGHVLVFRALAISRRAASAA